MKINYEKIKGKAIVTRDHYNTHMIVLAFVYDGKLPITKEHIHNDDMKIYRIWCNFLDKIRNSNEQFGDNFAIVLDDDLSEGCIYGDVNELSELGYEPISITDSLEEFPNICDILGVTPDQTLEECGLLELGMFSPHRITLDGVIRGCYDGCLKLSDVLDLMRKVGYITKDYNKLYDLFDLSSQDYFKIYGRVFDGFSSEDNLKELMEVCEDIPGLIYEIINEPYRIKKIETLENVSIRNL